MIYNVLAILLIIILFCYIYKYRLKLLGDDGGKKQQAGNGVINGSSAVTHLYEKSYFYDENSFPLNLIVLNNRYRIAGDLEILQLACKRFNNMINYKVFNLDIVEEDFHTYIPKNRDLQIFTVKYAHLNHEAFDGKGCILAHATLPPFRILCFDASETWSYIKFYCTFLHELGHILGLMHSKYKDSIMYASLLYTQVYSKYDLEDLYTIYPFMRISNMNESEKQLLPQPAKGEKNYKLISEIN